MPTADERLAAMEARVDGIAELRVDMRERFTLVDQRFIQIDQRFMHLEAEMHRRFTSLDAKVDRNFVWTMGTMMTGFIAVIAALIGVAYR